VIKRVTVNGRKFSVFYEWGFAVRVDEHRDDNGRNKTLWPRSQGKKPQLVRNVIQAADQKGIIQ
jgi:hypothetical protein